MYCTEVKVVQVAARAASIQAPHLREVVQAQELLVDARRIEAEQHEDEAERRDGAPVLLGYLISPRELEFLDLVCAPEELTYEQIADAWMSTAVPWMVSANAFQRSSASRARPGWCSSP